MGVCCSAPQANADTAYKKPDDQANVPQKYRINTKHLKGINDRLKGG